LILNRDLLRFGAVTPPNWTYSLLGSLRERFSRRLFAGLIGAYFLAGTAFGMMALVTPVHAVRMDTPAWLIGLLQASLALGVMLTILPAGFLVDRYGPRKIFVFGAAATGLVSLMVPLIGNFSLLMGAVMLIGGFSSFAAAALNVAFFNHEAKAKSGRAAWYKGAWMAGLSLSGPIVAGGAIRLLSAPTVFYIIGGFWLAQALAAAILTARREPKKTDGVTAPLAKLKDLAATPQLIGASMLEGLSVTTVAVFSTFVSIVVIRKFGLSAPHIALLISLQGIGYAATLIWGTGISARISQFGLRVCGSAGAALTFVVFAFAPSFPTLAAASLALGLSLGLLGLTNVSPLTDSKAERGSTVGFFGFGTNAFAFTGMVAGGLVGQAHGPMATLWPVPALHGAVILLMLLSILGAFKKKQGENGGGGPARSFSPLHHHGPYRWDSVPAVYRVTPRE
jgi:MFS family permease